MSKNNIWSILGINETKEQEIIKDAYRKKLVHTHPEDDAEGFMQLRSAFEEAMKLSTLSEVGEEIVEKNDIDLWIDELNNIYVDIQKRNDISLWEKLLDNPVCKGLDTYLETREKLLAYLMNNYYLPHQVWILFENEFSITRDKENLIQIFPKNFIEYIIVQINKYSSIDLSLFNVSENKNVDDYIRSYYDIKRTLDNAEQLDKLPDEFVKIDKTGIYNPYIDAEKIRYFINIDNQEEINNLINKLKEYLNDEYISFYVAKGYWAIGNYEDAVNIWESLLKKNPKHYGASVGLLEHHIHKGRYKEANEKAIELLRVYNTDEVHSLLVKANEHLIKEYEETLNKDPDDLKIKEELAWCYYQNSHFDKCIELLDGLPNSTKNEEWFLKLCTYVYGSKNDNKRALKNAFIWLERLKNIEPNDEINRSLRMCNQLIGIYYINLKEYDKSVSYLKNAISLSDILHEKLSYMERLSFALLKSGNNEDCIDVCDDILNQNDGYYPAYLNRQEAYFNMKNGQAVIDDYYSAVEIFSDYVRPYLLAAKVYYFYSQYEDSIAVVERAREAGLYDKELELYYGISLRLKAGSKVETEEAINILLDLSKNMKKSREGQITEESNEFNDLAEVYHEISKAYADMGQYEESLNYINSAIEIDSNDHNLETTKAYIYMDLEYYDKAIDILEKLVDLYPEDEYKHIYLARNYEKIDRSQDALECLNKVLDINSENLEAIEKIGDIYLDLYVNKEDTRYYEKAISYGKKLLELSQNCYFYVHVGIMYERGCEFEKSIECYQKASEYDPKDIWPHNNAGYVYKRIGRYEDAISEYKKAIELMEDDQSMLPYRNLATCYEILGLYEEAMDCYNKVLEYWPDHIDTHERIADLLVYTADIDEAESKYLNLIKEYDYPKEYAYNKLMNLFKNHGSTIGASYYSQQLIDLNRSVDNLTSVGNLYYSLGFKSRAKGNLKKAEKWIQNKNSYRYILCCLSLAQVYFDENNRKNAKELASKALIAIKNAYGDINNYLSYKPNSALHNYYAGMAYLLIGDLKNAELYLKESTNAFLCTNCRSKGCYEGYYGLGRLYEELKDFELAEKYYKMAFENHPDPLYMRCIKEMRDEKDSAIKAFFKEVLSFLKLMFKLIINY